MQDTHAVRATIALYCATVGLFMMAWWGLEFRAGALRRPDRAPSDIGLHLAAELVTAALLVAAGVVLLAGGAVTVALVALGMLLYTVIQSPGYFVARHEAAPVAMFAALAVLTATALAGAVSLT
jgi:hypothetical protein